MELLKNISQFIAQHHLCGPEDRVLIAISGGPDSVFLAYAMHTLGYKIGFAHVNYQLRGEESDKEEALVRAYANFWNLPLFVHREDTPALLENEKDSLQQVARRIRYDFFEQIMDAEAYDRCALAHQADDQSEQAILSLLTGNASEVLQQIPVRRDRYIRPLLNCTRKEILEVSAMESLRFATDSSNLKNDYLRNRVRNKILPQLAEINPKTPEQLRMKQAKYAAQKGFLDVILDRWMQSCLLTLPEDAQQMLDWRPFVDTWGKEHLPLLIAYVLEQWGMHGHLLWQGVSLIDGQVGKKVYFEENTLLRIRNGLQWGKEVVKAEKAIELTESQISDFPISMEWEGRQIQFDLLLSGKPQLSSKRHFYLNMQQLHFPLVLRNWREGDVMQPLGMTGHKKLSDIFVDEKYTSVQKLQAFVLEDREKVLLLSDFRIAESVRLTADTDRILVVEVL